MQFEDGPQLPLTTRRKVLVAIGAAMAVAQLSVAVLVAPATTGPDFTLDDLQQLEFAARALSKSAFMQAGS